MKVPYSILAENPDYKTYYQNQAGGVLPVFIGSTVQKGYGLGSMFSRVLKGNIIPMLRQAANPVGTELLNTGASVVNGVMRGENTKSAVKRNLINGGKNLLTTFTDSLAHPKKNQSSVRHSKPRQFHIKDAKPSPTYSVNVKLSARQHDFFIQASSELN